MELMTVEQKIEQIQNLLLMVDIINRKQLIRGVPLNQCADFDNLIGENVSKGSILQCDGKKYMVIQDTILQAHFRPSSPGLTAIFQLHQGNGVHEWISGEYCEIGDIRTVDGIAYEAYQDPSANVHSPDLVPAIWREIIIE